jgi:hypothetical protein
MTRGRIGQIFGRRLTAYSLSAGVLRAAPGLSAHFLHLVFVSAGDADLRVRYRSSVVKAGRSVAVVRVYAVQEDRVLATSLVQCHGDEANGEHGIVALGGQIRTRARRSTSPPSAGCRRCGRRSRRARSTSRRGPCRR